MKTSIVMLYAVSTAAILSGCHTTIQAEKNPERALPLESVVTVNGEERVITTDYKVTSGGWSAEASSPLFAKEDLDGLKIGVNTNGTVSLEIQKYNRDVSTNAVVLVKTVFDGSANLATAIAKGYATIATGGATDATAAIVQKVYSLFTSSGGDASKSTVTSDGTTLTVSDGATCVTCDAAGNCTTGTCSD